MRPWPRVVPALAVVGLAVTGCSAPPVKERVVLLPGSDGHVGALVVSAKKARTELRSAYASSTLDGSAGLRQAPLSPAEVQRLYGDLIATLPVRPRTVVLFFEGNSDAMTGESAEQAERLATGLAKAASTTEIKVIGHTDRNGSTQHNLELSRARALAIRDFLAARGVDPQRVAVEARGEGDPAVPTEDGVLEPRNRRVEVTVR